MYKITSNYMKFKAMFFHVVLIVFIWIKYSLPLRVERQSNTVLGLEVG